MTIEGVTEKVSESLPRRPRAYPRTSSKERLGLLGAALVLKASKAFTVHREIPGRTSVISAHSGGTSKRGSP